MHMSLHCLCETPGGINCFPFYHPKQYTHIVSIVERFLPQSSSTAGGFFLVFPVPNPGSDTEMTFSKCRLCPVLFTTETAYKSFHSSPTAQLSPLVTFYEPCECLNQSMVNSVDRAIFLKDKPNHL